MRRSVQILLALGLFALLATPTGSRAQDESAMLRVMHAVPDAPAVDVYINSMPIDGSLSFFSISDYGSFPAGEYIVQVTPADAGLDNVIFVDSVTLNSGQFYTIMLVNIPGGSGITQFLVEDTQSAPPAGEARINLYHAASDAPVVDIKLAGTETVVARDAAFSNAASLTAPAGTYQFDITPTGSSDVVYTTPPLLFLSGWGYTLAATGFLEQPGSFAVQSRVDYTSPAELASVSPSPPAATVYVAELRSLNTDITEQNASGTATFTVNGDTLTMQVEAQGLYPGTMHLQHYHGFTDGQDATCPPLTADTNGDDIIDLLETRSFTGITLVPLHEDPVSLEIQNQTYPVASEPDGSISYEQTVSVSELEAALQSTHGISELALDQRTVFLHGINPDASLPDSVQSLPEVPPQVTLPVACGELMGMN